MRLSNFKIRTLISVLGIPLLAAMTLYTEYVFAGFFTIAGFLILNEIFKAMEQNGNKVNRIAGFPLYFLMIFMIWDHNEASLPHVLLFAGLILMTWEMFRKHAGVYENVAITLFAALFTALSLGYLIRLQQMEQAFQNVGGAHFGGWAVLTVFVGVWSCDTIAYLIGSAFGRHKIFPRVSPNKSWEGSLAGLFAAILAVSAMQYAGVLPGLNYFDALVIGLITGGAGQVGDFAESLVKRDVNIKDSSKLLPGHGGAWDRLDSILFAAPLSYVYISYIVGF